MYPHAKSALRLNLCSFCSPAKLSAGAKLERQRIIKNPASAADDAQCVELDKEKPGTSLIGKGYGPVQAEKVFQVGVTFDLNTLDGRPVDKAWPEKWHKSSIADLASEL